MNPFSPSRRADLYATLTLLAVWLVFFWRIFTPNVLDQSSFQTGDYFGQFTTFGAYQYERLSAGEIPLWNPYNNGGLPFIADTQAAALYPPRLLTIALVNLSGGDWTYSVLSVEIAFHLLFYTLTMYLFIRRLTLTRRGSVIAGLVAALSSGYGGWMTSYPLLQVALLEAAVWLPLGLLGVLEATRHDRCHGYWIAFAGWMLGLSWMAGHPQTAWFATYLLVAYWLWRVWTRPARWRWWLIGTALMGVLTLGTTAVQLLPGAEYLTHTMRTGLTLTEKSGGFVFSDLSTFVYPRVFWSPLYFGVIGFALAVIGLSIREHERWFWLTVFGVGLALSFGAHSPAFYALYNLVPGMGYFRGQERAVFLVVNSAAVLAAFGVIYLHAPHPLVERFAIARMARRGAFFAVIFAFGFYALWFDNPESYNYLLDQTSLTALVAVLGATILTYWLKAERPALMAFFVLLIAFELLAVNMDNGIIEPIPASHRAEMTPSQLVQTLQADDNLFRVDGGMIGGAIGIPPGGNTGSLYHLRDIRGISPLFLDGAHAIIQRQSPAPVAWEVFAVKYVFSDSDALPVPSQVIGRDIFNGVPTYLHQLDNPRPYATLLYDAETLNGDAFARELLADPAFDARETAILAETLNLDLPEERPADASAIIREESPERLVIDTLSAENAVLSVAQVDYPGWQVTVDGERVTAIRAYGAVTAIPLTAGAHTVTLRYQPMSFAIGAVLSLLTWAFMIAWSLVIVVRGDEG